jgi:hypothetical protein
VTAPSDPAGIIHEGSFMEIYFEAKTGNDDWHKNHCPQSGHPVYLRLFIKATS